MSADKDLESKVKARTIKGEPEAFLREDNFKRLKGTNYCPGCGHGIVTKLIGDAIDYFGIREDTIGIACVGCGVFEYKFFDFDTIEASHGRAPAVATGAKRANPGNIVFTKQGDGDLASIGLMETVHTSNRNENICIFFVNNAIYGMTGGQVAPTSLIGQKTSTTPDGKRLTQGAPIKVCELLDECGKLTDSQGNVLGYEGGPTYIERVAVYDALQIRKLENAIKKAIRIQMKGQGFSLVEILSPCPTNWGLSCAESMEFTKNEMAKVFPLGVYRDLEDKRESMWRKYNE